MTVCANRDDTPGSFTSCIRALGSCLCGTQVATDLANQTTDDTTEGDQ